MDHVGVVVTDLAAAIEFFVALGLELEGEMSLEGRDVDRLIGLDGVRTSFAFVRPPGGHGGLELIEFHSPPSDGGDAHAAANAPGLRHVTFAVDDIHTTLARLQARGAQPVGELVRYGDSYWLCYVRGPDGIIVELAEKIG
jgi:catechol 2,3-dioxygenase-like lactoylglutathione lyase family enzyme